MWRKLVFASCLTICCLATMGTPSSPQDSSGLQPREKFSALAYLPGVAGTRMTVPGTMTNLDIIIDSYSTGAEGQQLARTLLNDGPDALLKALENAKSRGKVSLTGQLDFFELKLVQSQPTSTGRRIVAISDRPIHFLEPYYPGRSKDYAFGILELELGSGEKEEGTGTLIYAVTFKVLKGGKVEIENYGFSPVQIKGVRRL